MRPLSDIDLNGLEGGNAGTVTLKLSTNIITNNIQVEKIILLKSKM